MNTKRELTQAAQAAKLIRKELKQAFPHIKFSVRSSNYAGGDSIHIGWQNGVTEKEVEKIVNKYQYGHFDGSIDLYEYSNSRDDIPQTKYVSASRTITDDILNQAFEAARKYWACLKDVITLNQNIYINYCTTPRWFLLNKLKTCDLSNGFKLEHIRAA